MIKIDRGKKQRQRERVIPLPLEKIQAISSGSIIALQLWLRLKKD